MTQVPQTTPYGKKGVLHESQKMNCKSESGLYKGANLLEYNYIGPNPRNVRQSEKITSLPNMNYVLSQ